MATTRSAIGLGALVAVGAGLSYAGIKASEMISTAAGYKARVACSEVFVAGRPPQDAEADFDLVDPALRHIGLKFDLENKEVRGSAFGLGGVRVVYEPHYGCALAVGGELVDRPTLPKFSGSSWPRSSDTALSGKIDAVLAAAFKDQDAGHRALLVIKRRCTCF